MKKIAIIIITAFFYIPIALSQSNDNSNEHNIQEVKEYLKQFDKNNSPGLVISILEKGKIIYGGNCGMADLENNIPIRPNSVFDLASVAKSFTGIAVAMLAEQNILSIGDDIRKYLPQVPVFSEKITIGHLLHHCSGLRDWVGTLTLSGRTESDVILPRHIWNVILNMKELNFKPGEKFSYSNTNYFLLAAIIEKVTKQPFHQWMQSNLFIPLGMHGTFVANTFDKVTLNKAKPYDRTSDGRYRNMSNLLVSPGSSSMFSTIEDLSKWLIDLQEHRIISEKVYNTLTETATFNDGSQGNYGYGCDSKIFQGHSYLTHGGWWQGYRSKYVFFPKEKLSIVVLSNSLDISPDAVVTKAAKIFLNILDKPVDTNEETSTPERINMSTHLFDKYAGTYRHDAGCFTVFKVWRDGAKFMMQCSGGFPENEAIPISDTSFFTVPENETIYFSKNNTNNETLNVQNIGSEDNTFIKTTVISTKEQEKELNGIYYSDEIQTNYSLNVKDGILIASHFQNPDVIFQQNLTNVFSSENVYFQTVEFIYNKDKHIEGFRLTCDSERVKNLLFRKIN